MQLICWLHHWADMNLTLALKMFKSSYLSLERRHFWDMFGTYLGHIRDMNMGHIRDIYGTCMEHIWDISWDIHWAYIGNILGIYMACLGHTVGLS